MLESGRSSDDLLSSTNFSITARISVLALRA